LLDGRDIREVPLRSLRKTIGVVPQETMLFSDTLARNIAFGEPDAKSDAIERAANVAGLGPDIATLPHGLDTIVGERGMALSGGCSTIDPVSWFWTMPFPASTRRPSGGCWKTWKPACATIPVSWSPIAPRPCATPTRSLCWKMAK